MNNIRYIGNIKVYNDEYLLKKKSKDLNYLYNYLSSMDFNNYPRLIEEYKDYYKSEYILKNRDSNINDTLEMLGILHNKTSKNKNINEEAILKVYNNINDNINNIKYYYEKLLNDIENEEYNSPSSYLIIRNSNLIMSLVKYSSVNLEKWKKNINENNSIRVSIIHNNPKVEHTIINDNKYLISFDNYDEDIPILDLYKLYKNENYNIDVLKNIDVYLNNNKLDDNELLLFKILVSIPNKFDLKNNEYLNTINVRTIINNMYFISKFVSEDKET